MATSIEVAGLHHGGMPIPVASRVGPLLESGGISGMDRSSSTVPDDLESQIRNLFENVAAVMSAAGGSTADIVKLTVYLEDRSARELVNEQWLAMFPDRGERPARHVLEQPLPGALLAQASIVAYIEQNHAG